jgi:UDP-N-acetylglucosamine:LPS N-acetylglucosamine transferase
VALGSVAIVSASFGSGHDVAARELAYRLTAHGIQVRTYDFVDLLGPRLGRYARSIYARQLTYAPSTWGRTLDLLRDPRGAQWAARMSARFSCLRMAEAVHGVSAVVSTYPLASLALGQMRDAGRVSAPVITFFTDLSVHPLWVSDGVDLHLAPSALAAAQAREAGADVVAVTSPAVDRRRFHPLRNDAERFELRRKYGLPIDGRLALISSGSWGIGEVDNIARDVARTGQATPVIACGRNDQLRARISRAHLGPALGWIDDMGEVIRACDVVVTNAGGLTGMEAIASEVPLIAYRCLPGHGLTNAEAMHETGLGVHAGDVDELAVFLANPWPSWAPGREFERPSAIFDYLDPARLIVDHIGHAQPAPHHTSAPTLAGVA